MTRCCHSSRLIIRQRVSNSDSSSSQQSSMTKQETRIALRHDRLIASALLASSCTCFLSSLEIIGHDGPRAESLAGALHLPGSRVPSRSSVALPHPEAAPAMSDLPAEAAILTSTGRTKVRCRACLQMWHVDRQEALLGTGAHSVLPGPPRLSRAWLQLWATTPATSRLSNSMRRYTAVVMV